MRKMLENVSQISGHGVRIWASLALLTAEADPLLHSGEHDGDACEGPALY